MNGLLPSLLSTSVCSPLNAMPITLYVLPFAVNEVIVPPDADKNLAWPTPEMLETRVLVPGAPCYVEP